MKTKITNYLMLLSGVVFLLAACDPPENTTGNRITFDGKTYKITNAGKDFDGVVALYFNSGEDVEAWFELHLDGEIDITESATFTFAPEGSDDYGKPGTFSEGGFKNETTEAEVTSGTIKVNVSGDVYNIVIDCVCEGGRKLTVNYSGPLEYEGPLGTTTFTIGGVTFPYGNVFRYETTMDEYSGTYATEFEILAGNATGSCELDCELEVYHSTPDIDGTYDFISFEVAQPVGPVFVVGTLSVDYYETEETIYGYLAQGKVTFETSGNTCTITFEDVKLQTENSLLDVTGAYTGVMIDAFD